MSVYKHIFLPLHLNAFKSHSIRKCRYHHQSTIVQKCVSLIKAIMKPMINVYIAWTLHMCGKMLVTHMPLGGNSSI